MTGVQTCALPILGMRIDTTRADITQAVLEGVAFALRDCLQVARTEEMNVNAKSFSDRHWKIFEEKRPL